MIKQRVFLAMALTCFLTAVAISAQSYVTMHIATFLTPTESQETGYKSLTSSQQAAWDRWVARYTALVLQTVSTSSSVQDYPTSKGHWIEEVCCDGSIVTLEDGSVWSVESSDQTDTALWLPTTNINVAHLTKPVGEYRFLLTNTEDHEKAHAKYLGMK